MGNIRDNAVYILSIDAKDIFLAEQLGDDGYRIRHGDGKLNTRRFINTLDYSLDLIRMRKVYYRVYRNRHFGTWIGGKEYSTQVINLTFKYSVKEYNIAAPDTYVKLGYECRASEFTDGVVVRDGVLVGVKTGLKISHPVGDELLRGHFVFEDGKYRVGKLQTLTTTDELRRHIYEDGFWCDGTHYVRWKRSCGSSRVGKCLFINEALYKSMHRGDLCGLSIKDGKQIDLAALESYMALTLSSIIDTVTINPKNILVIDDYDSVFNDNIIAVEASEGKLECAKDSREIANTIWDGQSLIDKSLMGKYEDKGMILLRNSFFKSCCFNCNVQQWFADNGITSVEQLNGFTLAQDISDVKLITTPKSIKYVAFGTVQEWLERIEPEFGLVKYDKKTHFFGGRLVQTHYQLLNSVQMTRQEVSEFLKPSLDFIRLLKSDPDVVRYYAHCNISKEIVPTPVTTKNQVVYKLLGVNNRFAQTRLYREFLYDLMRSIYKNLKSGHVLVNGNYSTLCGNPIEMLLSAIGKFDGTSQIGVGNVHSTRFDYGKTLLGSRSPHITMSNVWLMQNCENELIDRYMNGTDEILYMNSIGENVLFRLSGCDFDSDCVLLTDNATLIKAAKRNDGKFPIACGFVQAQKTKRTYSSADIVDLDIKTSSNKIGEIVNLSQELNTKLWDKLNRHCEWDDVDVIYDDICKLNVLSNIEIDKAKREYCVDSTQELQSIRDKHGEYVESDDGNRRAVKPFFFAHVARQKGYYNSERKMYKRHLTTMDFVQTEINSFKSRNGKKADGVAEPLSVIVDRTNYDSVDANRHWRTTQQIIQLVADARNDIKGIESNNLLPKEMKLEAIGERRQRCVEAIEEKKINSNMAIYLLDKIEKDCSSFRQFLLYILFDPAMESFYNVLCESREQLYELVEDDNGDIVIYGRNYKKSQK